MMERQRSSRPQRASRLLRSRAVESPSGSSSADEAADPQSLGSRMRLLRRGKSASHRPRSEEPENTIVQIEAAPEEPGTPTQPPPQPAKESSIAQSIKRRFGFFRKSEREKSNEDLEAAVPVESHDTPEPEKPQILDVVVDVHCENENGEKASGVIKKTVASKSEKRSADEEKTSSPEMIVDSLDLIEEAQDMQMLPSPKNGFFESVETVQEREEESELEIPVASGGESSRRRKRWEKAEVTADDLVEDLTKPRRRKWAQGAASAEIRNVTGQKIVLPKRSATAEPFKQAAPRSSKASKPIAAPRSKRIQKEEDNQGFDNEGFSSDHDEVLRVETINDQSPKIEIGSAKVEDIEEGASTLSEEELKKPSSRKTSIVEIEELPGIEDTTEQSDAKELSPRETIYSPEFMGRKSTARRRSRNKRKFSIDKKSEIDDEEDEVDEVDEVDEDEEEEQQTVMNAADKKSKRAGSSKIEIISSTSFQKDSSDETTISTNEDMHTSRRDTHRSRSKSKSSRHRRSDDASERSSRARRKTTSSSTRNSAEELSSGRKSTRSRRKKRHRRREKTQQPPVEHVDEETRYVSVKIHRSDMLEADYVTRHPMVIVHLVNAITGEYLKKREGESSHAVQPILTGKFDFAEKKTMVPVWEEELIFQLDFKELLQEGKDAALVLFEIIDLLSFDEASICYDQFGRDACWYKVAWAFLRPVGISGAEHVEKKVRLQLYRPKKTFRKRSKNKCEVYKWWKSSSRDKYPSSLYVTVSSVEPPKLEPVLYEQPLDTVEALEMYSESRGHTSAKAEETEPSERPKWTRHAAQSCQIPNDLYFETEASDNGCFYLGFSNDGKFLACAMSEEYEYSIVVYKIDEGKIHVRFSGHKNFIYSLSWSHDDRYLLSVSSDQTARFWDVREQIIEHVQSLPHPSYVYCGKFSGSTDDLVVTGCYDHVARVWARSRGSLDSAQSYELVQELEVHQGFVNCVCFQPRGEGFLTGDCLGVVAVWAARRSRRSPIRTEWQLARRIKIREIEGIPVNGLLMHPLGSRLLVHSRNSGLRLVDLVSGVVVKKFEGLTNQRIQLTGCISPCGGLLFCGSEDSRLLVWNVDTGRLLARYEPPSEDKAIACVDYHPYDHVLAFATYGAPVPVRLLKYDRDADGRAVGLRLLVPAVPPVPASNTSMISARPTRNLELSACSLNSSANLSSVGHLLADCGEDDEARRDLKGKLQRFIEAGPNLKAKSMNRLNGIIEKIDRILMYATNQKSPANDLESARQSSVFAFEEPPPPRLIEAFEMEKTEPKRKKKKQRPKSARNACSPTPGEIEHVKAFSDSAALRKVSRFSDDSSNSNHSSRNRDLFLVERLDLKRVDDDKDSLDTIEDAQEELPSEEVLDVESLGSDDTYTVDKDKSDGNDGSPRSSATFVIENEVPVPKPRKRIGRIEVM